jgi:hypothetical protein
VPDDHQRVGRRLEAEVLQVLLGRSFVVHRSLPAADES